MELRSWESGSRRSATQPNTCGTGRAIRFRTSATLWTSRDGSSGICYVLGGGLFSPLTARIVGLGLRIGLRLAVLPMLKQEMAELVENLDDEEGKGKGASKVNVKRTRGDEP